MFNMFLTPDKLRIEIFTGVIYSGENGFCQIGKEFRRRQMVQVKVAIYIGCLLLLNAGCASNAGYENNTSNLVTETSKETEGGTQLAVPAYNETDFKNFEFEDARANCQASSECVLMPLGGCMNTRAIHRSQIELAEAYTDYAKKTNTNVMCAPHLPPEEYEALCLNQKCKEVSRSYRLLLEVPETPGIGKPFWLGMSFRFPISSKNVEAHFIVPEGVEVVSGEIEWSGPLEALQDHTMWIQLQSNRVGEITLMGWARAHQSDTQITPLTSGKKYMVENASNPLPQLVERIIATPTAQQ
jgi:hypothetical protein